MMASFSVPEGPIVVALSGGADSASCAWAAVRRSDRVRAVHVNHGLPGSAPMQRAACRVAEQLGLALDVVAVDVPIGPSPEAQARKARYAALRQATATDETVLIAHTADDQAETVLLNLLRGSGVDGLAGMPRSRPPFLRPLLAVERSVLRELASLLGLGWRDDPSNRDLALLRNRVRALLIPLLESEYSSATRENLVRTASLLGATREYLDHQVDLSSIEASGSAVRFPATVVMAMEPELCGRFVRAAVQRLKPDHPPSQATVHSILEVVEGSRRSADLEGGLRALRRGPMVLLERPVPSVVPDPIEVPFPGTANWAGWSIEMAVNPTPPVVPLSLFGIVLGIPSGFNTVVIGPATTEDRIPLARGSKRVFAAMAEAGVPEELRPRWPVVWLGDSVLWVPGVRRAVWAPGTVARYLCAIAVEEHTWETSGL